MALMVRPIGRLIVFISVLVTNFQNGRLLRPFILQYDYPFIARRLMSRLNYITIYHVIKASRYTFIGPIVLLYMVPGRRPSVFMISLIVVVIVIEYVGQRRFAMWNFIFHSRQTPSVRAKGRVFRVNDRTCASLFSLILLGEVNGAYFFRRTMGAIYSVNVVKVYQV